MTNLWNHERAPYSTEENLRIAYAEDYEGNITPLFRTMIMEALLSYPRVVKLSIEDPI
tara:strand:- start:1933 stop:2106 length:174 start_codon:yes stop_codon:yes gene_type:complete